MNGVPWWFGAGLAALGSAPLASVDPGGVISEAIPLRHVVGCVVHAAATTTAPGIAAHRMGRGLILGEPAGGESARLRELAALLTRAGFEVDPLAAHPLRHLVQAMGQHDHEPGLGAHRRHHRPRAR